MRGTLDYLANMGKGLYQGRRDLKIVGGTVSLIMVEIMEG